MERLSLNTLTMAVILALVGCNGDDGKTGAAGAQGQTGEMGKGSAGQLTRIATVPLGAEVTGIFLSDEGDLFFNVQHPSDSNTAKDPLNGIAVNTGTVGVLSGVNVNALPETLAGLPVPSDEYEQQTVQSAYGQYQILGQTGSTYAGKLAKGLGHIYNCLLYTSDAADE